MPKQKFGKQKAEIAGAPRGYKRAAALMDAVYLEFMDGASISRLARKHSQPRHIVEFILRVARLFFRLRKVVGAPALARVSYSHPHDHKDCDDSLHAELLASSLIPARSFFWSLRVRNQRAHRLGRWLSVSPQFGRYS